MKMKKTEGFDLVDLKGFDEKELETAEGMNKVTQNIIYNINGYLTQRIAKNSLPFDKSEYFNHTFIGGKSVNEHLNSIEQDKSKTFENAQRNKLGAFLIARALVDNNDVILAQDKNTLDKGSVINNAFEEISSTLTLWDKILDFLGIRSAKTNIKNFQSHLSAVKENIIENDNSSQKAIVAENFAIAEEHVNKIHKFKNLLNTQSHEINNMYFKNMPDECFKGEKNFANFSSFMGIDHRTFDDVAVCIMLKNRYSLEQACDPTFTQGRSDVSKELSELFHLSNSNDKENLSKARAKLDNILLEGAKKFLQQPVPPREELENYLDSKRPHYLKVAADFGFNLFQNVSKNEIFKDPSNEHIIHSLAGVSQAGMLTAVHSTLLKIYNGFASTENMTPEKTEASKRSSCLKAMDIIVADSFYKEHADHSGKTLVEYSNANMKNAALIQAFIPTASGLSNFVFAGENDTAKLKDVVDGKTSITEMVQHEQSFIETLESRLSTSLYMKGTSSELAAKAELAKNVATKMGELSEQKFNQEQMFKVANELMVNENFLKKTLNMEPAKILKLMNNSNFIKELADDFTPTKPKKENSETKKKQPEKKQEIADKKNNPSL